MDGYMRACVHALVCACMHVCVKTVGTTNRNQIKVGVIKEGVMICTPSFFCSRYLQDWVAAGYPMAAGG